jgi:ubiquinone/menaquinone biosynthesis C-methylase UbiE
LAGDSDRVRRYYDANTPLLLGLGQGTEGSIHRAVWGPGVTDRRQAMAYVDTLVIDRVKLISAQSDRTPHVVDLGSGVGASLCRIADQVRIHGTGITISGAQAEMARRRIAARGLTASVRSIEADFCNLPGDVVQADLAFAIESFVHAASAAAFFRECARLVRPGGSLIVCDDFVADAGLRADPQAARWLDRFRSGWLAGNLVSFVEANALARSAGFTHDTTIDLSSHIEIGRPRDYAVALLMRGFGWLPVNADYWSMLRGGDALQVCLKRGWITHLFSVWTRQ